MAAICGPELFCHCLRLPPCSSRAAVHAAGGALHVGLAYRLELWRVRACEQRHPRLASVRTEGVLGAGQAGFLTLLSLPFLGGECVGLGTLYWACGWRFLHYCRRHRHQRTFSSSIEGPHACRTGSDGPRGRFQHVPEGCGRRSLQTIAPPDKTPQLFERFLPYALALGVEHAWAEQFSQVLAQAAAAAAPAAAQAIHLRGIRAQVFVVVLRLRVSHRASAVRFPALSHRLPPLPDHLPARVVAVLPAAVVGVEAGRLVRPRTLGCTGPPVALAYVKVQRWAAEIVARARIVVM